MRRSQREKSNENVSKWPDHKQTCIDIIHVLVLTQSTPMIVESMSFLVCTLRLDFRVNSFFFFGCVRAMSKFQLNVSFQGSRKKPTLKLFDTKMSNSKSERHEKNRRFLFVLFCTWCGEMRHFFSPSLRVYFFLLFTRN